MRWGCGGGAVGVHGVCRAGREAHLPAPKRSLAVREAHRSLAACRSIHAVSEPPGKVVVSAASCAT